MTVDNKASAETRAEARAWFLRLTLADDPNDVLEWDDWLSSDPSHGAAYDQVVKAWELSRHTDAIALNEGENEPIVAPLGRAWYRRQPHQLMAMAASLAAIVAVATLTSWSSIVVPPAKPIDAPTKSFSTRRGEHQVARLIDGSQIALGGATRVAINLTANRRNVSLQSGQIFVNVAKDPNRAFVVQTPFSSVTAVGTAFDVDLVETGFTLSVLHGTVLLKPSPAGAKAAIRPTYVGAGKRVAVSANGFRSLPWIAIEGARPGWMTGRLEYRDVPLRSVVQDVNRYASSPIILVGPASGDLRYTGSVDVNHIRPWLTGVAQAFQLDMGHNGGSIQLRRKSPS